MGDILIIGNNTFIKDLITKLIVVFSLKNLAELNFFLGVKITRIFDDFHLSESKYINDLINKVHLNYYKPIFTTMIANVSLSKIDGK